jgi:hypothetical protein
MRTSRSHKDAGPTVFGWEEEPADERPSEYGTTSVLGPASGYYRGGSAPDYGSSRRRRGGLGWIGLVLWVLLLGVAAWAALRWLVPMLG